MDKISQLEDTVKKIEERLLNLEQKISNLEKLNSSTSKSRMREIPNNVIKKIDKISTRHLIIILLSVKPNQSFKELQEMLLKIGWIKDTFFEKNFSSSLIKKGLVQASGKDSERKESYSLTMKGELEAEKILDKFKE